MLSLINDSKDSKNSEFGILCYLSHDEFEHMIDRLTSVVSDMIKDPDFNYDFKFDFDFFDIIDKGLPMSHIVKLFEIIESKHIKALCDIFWGTLETIKNRTGSNNILELLNKILDDMKLHPELSVIGSQIGECLTKGIFTVTQDIKETILKFMIGPNNGHKIKKALKFVLKIFPEDLKKDMIVKLASMYFLDSFGSAFGSTFGSVFGSLVTRVVSIEDMVSKFFPDYNSSHNINNNNNTKNIKKRKLTTTDNNNTRKKSKLA